MINLIDVIEWFADLNHVFPCSARANRAKNFFEASQNSSAHFVASDFIDQDTCFWMSDGFGRDRVANNKPAILLLQAQVGLRYAPPLRAQDATSRFCHIPVHD